MSEEWRKQVDRVISLLERSAEGRFEAMLICSICPLIDSYEKNLPNIPLPSAPIFKDEDHQKKVRYHVRSMCFVTDIEREDNAKLCEWLQFAVATDIYQKLLEKAEARYQPMGISEESLWWVVFAQTLTFLKCQPDSVKDSVSHELWHGILNPEWERI